MKFLKGYSQIVDAVRDLSKLAEKPNSLSKTPIVNSERLGSAGDKISERGSLAERLSSTPEEAEAIKQANDIRLGLPTYERKDISEEELSEKDQKIIERMVDDIVRNLFD